jgi:murein DD-endopeptidase MepM/ murein hydrolase activator NlpD
MFFLAGDVAAAPRSKALEQQIEEKKGRIQSEKQTLNRLTEKEKDIYSDLARVEERIKTLSAKVESEREKLQEVQSGEEELKQESARLEKKIETKRGNLRDMIERLWPLYIQNKTRTLKDVRSWDEADRRFTWLASIYGQAEEMVQDLQDARQALEKNLARQKSLRRQAQAHLESISSAQDELLEKRLEFVNRLHKVRARRLAKEEQLASIEKTIQDLEYKLKTLRSHKIEDLKGYLPWPAGGDLIAGYAPDKNPPNEGLGFSLSKNAPVQAVSWGKVVYNDMLRGFGRVVIIYHGQHYYTLYAYLAESGVKVGQDVEKGEIIGEAGFYPVSKGPGLYFELRRGKSPIDPGPWLGKRG